MGYKFSQNSGKKPHIYGQSFQPLVAAGSVKYKRHMHLQHLLPVAAEKIDDQSWPNCKWILSRLATALRQERNRGQRGHWAYSLNRHIGLLQAYRGERENLQKLKR